MPSVYKLLLPGYPPKESTEALRKFVSLMIEEKQKKQSVSILCNVHLSRRKKSATTLQSVIVLHVQMIEGLKEDEEVECCIKKQSLGLQNKIKESLSWGSTVVWQKILYFVAICH